MRCALHISYIFLRPLGADTVSGVEGGLLFLNWTRYFTWAHLHAVQVTSTSVSAYPHTPSLSLVNIWASRVGPYLHFLFISHCSRCLGNSGPIFFLLSFLPSITLTFSRRECRPPRHHAELSRSFLFVILFHPSFASILTRFRLSPQIFPEAAKDGSECGSHEFLFHVHGAG